MPKIYGILIGLAVAGFLLAIAGVLMGPILGFEAESYSRASNNVALIAIALAVCSRPAPRKEAP